jgi:hypothetical protein
MMRGLLAMTLLLTGCGRQQPMELWYWHHSYLATPAALQQSKALIDRAAAAGYTGMALWDSSLVFVSQSDWPYTAYLKEAIDYAHGKGLVVMPAILPYGHSDDVLKRNPDWAEGQRVLRVKFRRRGDALEHVPGAAIALGDGVFDVLPWHQYQISLPESARGWIGALDQTDPHKVRLDDEAHPGATLFTFNSQESGQVRIIAPAQYTVKEAALVHPVRREGAPLRVYDEYHVFREGDDYTALPLRVSAGSRIHEGQEVLVDYYAVMTVYGEGVGLCLTDPAVRKWAAENARVAAALLPDGSPLFLQHDEMRHLNSCASCRRMNKTAGDLLAWSLRGLIPTLPPHRLYIWSDMFDPWHNARDHFYYVEGSLKGSWEGLPRSVTVMNWNGGEHRRASLEWFAGRGNPQVIAGYYDPAAHDGYRAARSELKAAMGIRGVSGLMYTTWVNDYSQLEAYAQGARAQWPEYAAGRPW